MPGRNKLASNGDSATLPTENPLSIILPWKNPKVRSRHKRRMLLDKSVTVLAILSVLVVLYPLSQILYTFVYNGALAISIPRLTELTANGGLGNAIVGTGLLVIIASVFSIPVGVIGGIYLAEFSERSKYAGIVRFSADVLAGMPSIIVGYVGFLLLVLYFGWDFSLLAGSISLGVLMLPYIMRTTEISMRRVPTTIREGAAALGTTKSQTINRLTFSLATPGILTGILLSIGIAMGETAPLLYTAGSSNYYPCGLTHCPVGYLTYVVYFITNQASAQYQQLAYLAAFLLVTFVVAINLVARIGLQRVARFR